MRKRLIIAALAATALVVVTGSAYAVTSVVTANGTWTANPGQSTTSQTAVQQPINTDGSSNFKANGKAVIPIKFALTTGAGPFAFQSINSNNTRPCVTSDDSSSLHFNPDVNPTLAEISKLIANYDFTTGDCAVGSLRWTLYLKDGATDPPAGCSLPAGSGRYRPADLCCGHERQEHGRHDLVGSVRRDPALQPRSVHVLVCVQRHVRRSRRSAGRSRSARHEPDRRLQIGHRATRSSTLTAPRSRWPAARPTPRRSRLKPRAHLRRPAICRRTPRSRSRRRMACRAVMSTSRSRSSRPTATASSGSWTASSCTTSRRAR